MTKHKNFSTRLLSMVLAIAMLTSSLQSTAFAVGVDGVAVGASSIECHAAHDDDCGYREAVEDTAGVPCTHSCELCDVKDSGSNKPAPEAKECDCATLCTTDKQSTDCPVCKDGFDKCGFVEKKENPEYTAIMEKTKELLAWFDARMELVPSTEDEPVRDSGPAPLPASPSNSQPVLDSGAASLSLGLSSLDETLDDNFSVGGGMSIRGKDGYILTDEDKNYFLDGYDEIILLVDKLAESDPPASMRLTEDENFKRMYAIAQVMGGYSVEALLDAALTNGWDGTQTWKIFGNSNDATIAGSGDVTRVQYSSNNFSVQSGNTKGTTKDAQSTLDRVYYGTVQSGNILSLWGGSGGGNDLTAGSITMNSGTVGYIDGGAHARTIIGDTSITINGGTVLEVRGGYHLTGSTSTNVTVTGGNIGTVYGNGSGGIGSNVTISGGTVKDVYGRNMTTGNSTVNISGSANITGNLYGYTGTAATNGKTTFNITGGTIGGNVESKGGTSNTINISNVTIKGSVKGASDAKDTVNLSANPQIGSAGTANGVELSTLLNGKVNITGNLNAAARINLVPKTGIRQGDVLATASSGVTFSADNFTLSNGGFCYKDGQDLKYLDVPSVNVNAKSIYANGNALLINGTSDTSTTVYIDTNRNGSLDAGEKSLAAAGVANASVNNSDLSTYIIYGGAVTTPLTIDTKITITSGKVKNIYGGGAATASTVTGNATITMSGGTVERLFLCGNSSKVTGSSTANISGGIVIHTVEAPDSSVTGTKTVNLSGNPVIGNKTNMGINLSNLTNNKVTINGALTGSAGGITLTGLTNPDDATIVASSNNAAHANADKFVYDGKNLAASGNNIIISAIEPYFDGNDLFAVTNPILLMKETDGTVNAYWDKNSDSILDADDTIITKATATGEPSLWNIYGGRKTVAMAATDPSQITLLCGGFVSVNGGSKVGGDVAASEGINRIVRIGNDEANTSTLTGFNSTQYKLTFDAKGGTYATAFVWQPHGQPLAQPSTVKPVKSGSTFMGFYDAETGGKQYYREDVKAALPSFTETVPTTLYAKWSTSSGIFAGRYSHYQVFDCWRTPAFPQAGETFRVFNFAVPFNDVDGDGYQMTADEVRDKFFYFKPSDNSEKLFILYMADDVDGTNEKAISRNGRIFALGREGLIFISEGSEKGYFISLSQGFNYGDEITYRPTDSGPITEDAANNHPEISPTPWDPGESYAVNFNSQNANTLAMPSQISVHKNPAPTKVGRLPSDPVKFGNRFDGWYLNTAGTGEKITINTELTSDITAYAKWVNEVEYLGVTLSSSSTNLTPSAQFGASKGVKGAAWTGVVLANAGYKLPDSIEVTVGGEVLSEGYTYSPATGEITITAAKMTAAVIITVVAEPITYTVNYHANGAVGDPSTTEQIITFGTEVNAAAVGEMSTSPNNWTFKGWARTGDATAAEYAEGVAITTTNPVTLTDGATVTLYAVWDAADANVSLQNGSFENPVITGGSAWKNFKNGVQGLEWLTTAKDGMHELVRPSINANSANNAFNTRAASEGQQFAELNANHVGSLYQQVQTIPNSTLYWGADHRGRGGVDTMQIWIGAPADITKALDQYVKGGNKVSAVDSALLAKIKQMECRSDNKVWTNYEGAYTVPAGQGTTTFAFVSVSSTGGGSYGNLLDNIYFSFVKPPRRASVTVRTTIGGAVTISDGSMSSTVIDEPTEEYVNSLEYGNVLRLGVQAKDGYSFNGGYINGVLYHTKEAFLNASNNMRWTVNASLPTDVTILFSKNSTVIFNAQGGAYPKSEATLTASGASSTETLAAPTRQDFKFMGWLIAGGTTKLQANDTIEYVTNAKTGAVKLEVRTDGKKLDYPIAGGIVLIAQWEYDDTVVTEVKLKLDYNDGATESTTEVLNAADPRYILRAPTNAENRFLGWRYPMGELDAFYAANTVVSFEQNNTRPRVSIGKDLNVALPEMVMVAQWAPKQIAEVSIKTRPKTSYEYSDKFDPTGLVITVKYDNGTEKDVPYLSNESKFAFDPVTTQKLNLVDSKITITYTESDIGYDVALPITVIPKTITATVTDVNNKTYNGSTATTGGNITLTGVVAGDTVTASGSITFVDKNVGTNKVVNVSGITLSGADAANYRLASATLNNQATTAKITPKPVPLTWHNATAKTYDGAAAGVYASIASGIVTGDVCNVTVTDGNKINAGSHTATAAISNSNYAISGGNTKAYSINKATLTATYEGATLMYKDTVPNSAKHVTVTGFVNGETAATATNYSVPTVTIPNTDSTFEEILTPSGGAADNYSFIYVGGKFKVISREFNAVVLQDYIGDYDGGAHSLRINNTDSSVSGASIRYYTTEALATDDTTGTGGSIDPITRTDAGSTTVYFKVFATGYTSQTGTGTITINKKKVTAVLDAQGGKVYDGNTTAGGVTLKLNGLVGSDVTINSTIQFTDKNVGNNKMVQVTGSTLVGVGSGNYTLTNTGFTANTTASITQKGFALTWSGHTGLVYSGTAKNVTAVIPDGVLEAGDTCTVTVIGSNEVKVGTAYTATASLSNDNYKTTNSTQGYSIDKKTLTAKFNSETIAFNNHPALRINVTGFVNGESAINATGYTAPTIKTSPIPTNIGEHDIALQGGAASNYSFTLDDTGTLTITPLSMSDDVSSVGHTGEYNGAPHGISVVAPVGASITYGTASGTYEAFNESKHTLTDVGTKTIYYKVTMANYSDVIGSEVITITKKPLTPTVKAGTVNGKIYNGDTATTGGTLELGGIVGSDNVTASGTIVFVNKNVGKNKSVDVSGITLAGTKSGNYSLSVTALSNAATTAEITPKEATLVWSGYTGLVYDGTVKTVTAAVGNLIGDDGSTVSLAGNTATFPGSYTAEATELSNANYKLPLVVTQVYSIVKATITGIVPAPTIKTFDGNLSDGVTVSGTKAGDKLWYSTDGGTTWVDKIPQIGLVGETPITVKIVREHYNDLILAPVIAMVKNAPTVHIEKPVFDKDDIKKVTVGGTVTKGDYAIASQVFEIRKLGTTDWRTLGVGTTSGATTTYSQILTPLDVASEYELRLTATDSERNTATDTLRFRTQPKNPPTGEIEGSVVGTGSITVTIEMGNTVVATLTGLTTGDKFSFKNLPDGEYNLVATDSSYKITQMVTVKDGKTTSLGVVAIGVKQSVVKVTGDAPPVAVDGLNELFDTATFTDEANQAVTNGGTVEMRLTAAEAHRQSQIDDIKAGIGTDTLGLTVDLTVDMIITLQNSLSSIHNQKTVEGLLTVAVPLPSGIMGKTGYKAYRHHDGAVETLTLLKSGETPTEGSFIISGSYAYIYTSKFSTYAITYAQGSGGSGGTGGGGSSYQYYYINLKAGNGGSFEPDSRRVKVREGESAGFTIIPDEGYQIIDVKVDGESIGAVSEYIFRNVRQDHTLSATFERFEPKPIPPVTGGGSNNGGGNGAGGAGIGGTGNTTGGSTDSMAKPTAPVTEQPRDTESLEQSKENMLSDLANKRDEAIANLPDTLTQEQRQVAIDEINRIYDEAVKAIHNATSASEISELYNKAVRDFDSVVKETGGTLPSMAPTGKPFILLSALMALVAVALAVLTLRKRKKNEHKKRKSILATAGAVGTVLTFLLTTGWSGIAFANIWTLLVAVFAGVAAYFSLKGEKEETDSTTSI